MSSSISPAKTPLTKMRWTSADIELLPEDGKQYEIIDGELFMSRQPDWHHQRACLRAALLLEIWNEQNGNGKVNFAPGVIFADDADVAPDVVWISNERLAVALEKDGKLHYAPELVIEVLSFTGNNERRDREAKLKLYSRREVLEYWLLDWRKKEVEIYRRKRGKLAPTATLTAKDTVTTPLLKGFSCKVADLFS
jgi:Uma2 family endonuclease